MATRSRRPAMPAVQSDLLPLLRCTVHAQPQDCEADPADCRSDAKATCPGCGYDEGHLEGCPEAPDQAIRESVDSLVAATSAAFEEAGAITDRVAAELETPSELPEVDDPEPAPAPIVSTSPMAKLSEILRAAGMDELADRVAERESIPDYVAHISPGLIKAMAAVMEAAEGVSKTRTNDHGGYDYASVDDYVAALRRLLGKNELVVVQQQVEIGSIQGAATRNNQSGTRYLRTAWDFLVVHSSGGFLGPIHRTAVADSKMGATAFGAAESYAEKNFLRTQFLVDAGGLTEDVDQASGGRLPEVQTRRSSPPPRRQDDRRYQAGQAPASWQNRDSAPPPDDDDRIPMRSRQPAGNGTPPVAAPAAPTPGPRPAVFRLRARIQKGGVDMNKVVAAYPPATCLEELTDENIAAAHKRLTEVGVAALPGDPS